jgi:uncharacterized protein YndB with AHSA1/START domain
MQAPQQPDRSQRQLAGIGKVEPEMVTRSVDIDADVLDVWEALATNDGRERWIERDPNRVLIVECEESPDRISWWWWSGDGPPTHVALRIVAIPTGARVIITETGPSSFPAAQLAASFRWVPAFA